jgi:hypothetical protein
MAYTQLIPRHTPGAHVEEISRESAHYRLSIPSGFSDSYRLAQLDDYTKTPRRQFPHRSHLSLTLSARASSDSIAGTWGFGLWNDPFGLSLGFGVTPFRLPALPNAVWFFGASKENYLSFGGLDTASPTRPPVNGFLAQTFRAPKFHPLLILAGLAFPFSRKTTRRLLGKVIGEDGINLGEGDPSGSVESPHPSWRVAPTDWHRYRLDWSLKRVSFEVDEVQVFESAVTPNPPLGLVIWIDNQYAAFTPQGKIAMGLLHNDEAWLEIKDLELSSPDGL